MPGSVSNLQLSPVDVVHLANVQLHIMIYT